MKFEQRTDAGKPWFGTTVSPTFKLSPLAVCHAVMLSEHSIGLRMTRADLDKTVRDELLLHGATRLEDFAAVVDDLSPEHLQERWDWARVELLKNFDDLHGRLPALYE